MQGGLRSSGSSGYGSTTLYSGRRRESIRQQHCSRERKVTGKNSVSSSPYSYAGKKKGRRETYGVDVERFRNLEDLVDGVGGSDAVGHLEYEAVRDRDPGLTAWEGRCSHALSVREASEVPEVEGGVVGDYGERRVERRS